MDGQRQTFPLHDRVGLAFAAGEARRLADGRQPLPRGRGVFLRWPLRHLLRLLDDVPADRFEVLRTRPAGEHADADDRAAVDLGGGDESAAAVDVVHQPLRQRVAADVRRLDPHTAGEGAQRRLRDDLQVR